MARSNGSDGAKCCPVCGTEYQGSFPTCARYSCIQARQRIASDSFYAGRMAVLEWRLRTPKGGRSGR